MNFTDLFKKQVTAYLDDMRVSLPVTEMDAELRSRGLWKINIEKQQFETLFWAYFYAQACQHWVLCCLNNGIATKEIRNLFFKAVLDIYGDDKNLTGATAFGEAMYAANSAENEDPMIAILTAFIKKLGVDGNLAEEKTVEAFRWLAGVCEGYRSHFENEFDDFIATMRINGMNASGKRGKHV